MSAPSERVSVRIGPREVAQKLAYFKTTHIGVLAPRGWHCFGTYGSGGESIIVTKSTRRRFFQILQLFSPDRQFHLRTDGEVQEDVFLLRTSLRESFRIEETS